MKIMPNPKFGQNPNEPKNYAILENGNTPHGAIAFAQEHEAMYPDGKVLIAFGDEDKNPQAWTEHNLMGHFNDEL